MPPFLCFPYFFNFLFSFINELLQSYCSIRLVICKILFTLSNKSHQFLLTLRKQCFNSYSFRNNDRLRLLRNLFRFCCLSSYVIRRRYFVFREMISCLS